MTAVHKETDDLLARVEALEKEQKEIKESYNKIKEMMEKRGKMLISGRLHPLPL